ncbi:MAG: diguanylate cyclase domain-containing protein [Acidiferrobacterales bacterium]
MSATPAEHDLIESIKAQLEGLRKTPDGLFLYRMIDRGLKNRGGEYTGDTGSDFVSFLHALLHKYAANQDGDTVTRVKVRLLQQRLMPHLEDDEDKTAITRTIPSKPPAPEEVVLEGLPEEPDEPAPAFEPREEKPANDPVIATHANPSSPESLEIEGLELDESTFEKELEKRKASEVVEERQTLLAEQESPVENNVAPAGRRKDTLDSGGDYGRLSEDQASREAKSAAIKASLRPLVAQEDKEQTTAKLSTNRNDRHEIEINVEDTLSIDELPVRQVAKPQRTTIADRVPDNVREELSRSRRPVAEQKSSPPLSIDPTFNSKSNSVSSTPDIVVGDDTVSPSPSPAKPLATKSEELTVPSASSARSNVISRDRVDRLHETFAGKVADSISRSREYHHLLRRNLRALKLADSSDDVLDIKHLLVMGLEDLLKGNKALGKDLGATNHYLKISQLDRDLLKDELGRVRDQSLVDELTGLQNKVAFNKQIEAEIGRSKRYGFSLALSVVVLDQIENYRGQIGKDAGDEVIRTFANQILTGFRGYDAVARLNDNRFGILFPNTQKEGALSALEKAQKRAADTVIQISGKSLRLPTFTSSLTLYSPGDKPEGLLKRAYDALAVADENTRNKIVVALAQT